MISTTANRPERMRYVDADHGSDDPERCFEVGYRVLKMLERGVHRVEVFGYPKKERVQGVDKMVDG